jgi:hypothetical protein
MINVLTIFLAKYFQGIKYDAIFKIPIQPKGPWSLGNFFKLVPMEEVASPQSCLIFQVLVIYN